VRCGWVGERGSDDDDDNDIKRRAVSGRKKHVAVRKL
jgi:predicted transcriptional regulator